MNLASRPLVSMALAAFLIPVAFAAEPPASQGVLGLSASASIDIAKDVLSITFSTSREGTDANTIQAQLKQALDSALAEAKKAARPGQLDVQTGNFSLYPRYAEKGGISGWQGNAELIVEGRDIAGIGALAGRLTTLTIERVSFRLSREASQKVESDVAAEAIGRFRAKAADYAKQFGYATVTIREVNVTAGDSGFSPQPMARVASMSMSVSKSPLSVEPGKATVTATVNGTVQMK
ncbi:MAG: SIMPL domain-containing protein [Pseudomonadota bacterium]|nr:SIMPL domain-containing protein [Pseudomonadota bacterium]